MAFVVSRLRGRVRDPRLTLRLGAHAKRTTASRLAGSILFAGFGVLFVVLALTGNADTAPGFQQTLTRWMSHVATRLDDIPNAVAWPALAAVAVVLVFLVVRPRRQEERHEQEALD